MELIRTLIIDDEANARNVIKNMLQHLSLPVEIVGEAGSGEMEVARRRKDELLKKLAEINL